MIFVNNLGRSAALCALVAFGTATLDGQTATSSAPRQTERLVVPEGAPVRVILTEKLRFKLNQPVHARIVEPVYAFDREVVPAGADVLGHITGFKSAPRWVRITSMLGGNFTPLREPQLTFDTLVLKDGKSIPMQTSVSPGTDTVVRFGGGPAEQKKGSYRGTWSRRKPRDIGTAMENWPSCLHAWNCQCHWPII